MGESSYDYLRVSLVADNITPVAGSLLSSTFQIVQFNMRSGWQTGRSIVIPANFTGKRRLVFTWRNDGSSGKQTPAAVDKIKIYAANSIAEKKLL